MTSPCDTFSGALELVRTVDPIIANAIAGELTHQRSTLKMIASENYCSLACQAAMGNWLTDKYAEGTPKKRFYSGCEMVDVIESRAQELACELFGADHAYVQPHSGADANLLALWAILIARVQDKELERFGGKKLDELSESEYEAIRQKLCNQKMLGMALGSGGHLTHGYRHNVSSKVIRAYSYDVDRKTGLLDYAAIRRQAKEIRPLILLAGYSAYPRRIDFATMREIADEVGAVLWVDMAHFAGLVAGKVFVGNENPVAFAHICTTTTHKTLRGPRGGMVLCTKEFAETVDKGCPLVLGGPLPHVMAAKAISFKEALEPSFRTYAHNIVKNCQTLAKALQEGGAILQGGGTDNHLLLIDVSPLGLTGRQAESALRDCGICCNRNALAFDDNGPWYTSGLRLGTAALTTLGLGESEMKDIARTIMSILKAVRPQEGNKAKYSLDPAVIADAKAFVAALLARFPLYKILENDIMRPKG